jgi:signal transduction histidine kinase
MGAFEKVLPYYNRAYKIRQKRKDLNGLAENEAYFGDFYFKQKKYLDAIPFYIKSLNLCKQMDYTYLQKVNAEQLASCYASISKFDSALVYLKQAVALNNKLMDESTVQTINNLEIQFETEKKEKQIAEQDAKIAQQELDIKQGTYLLISIAGVGFIMLVISFFIIKQIRLKQKQLLEENKLKDEITKFKILTKLNDERLRIAKDLHDNIGAQLTFIISFLDNMLYVLDENNQQFKAKLTELNEFSKKAIKELRLTINQLNKN